MANGSHVIWKRSQNQKFLWGARVTQSVKRLTSAQLTISRFVGLSPARGSVLTAQSLEPASDSVSPSLSVPPHFSAQALSLSKINITKMENMQPRIHYPARLSFRIGEKKSFPNKN